MVSVIARADPARRIANLSDDLRAPRYCAIGGSSTACPKSAISLSIIAGALSQALHGEPAR